MKWQDMYPEIPANATLVGYLQDPRVQCADLV